MRILSLTNQISFQKEMERIGCDPAAFPIFQKKLEVIPIKTDLLTCASVNILKQVALSVGADCVIPREIITGRKRKGEGIILATRRQYENIIQKLQCQYPELKRLAAKIEGFFASRNWRLVFREKTYDLSQRTYIMGILNITPDSFYDGGRYLTLEKALRRAEEIAEEGADFLDIGAESSRPGSSPISAKEEINRLRAVLPVIRQRLKIPISCDTTKSEVARFALEEGCEIINDISGLRFDPRIAQIIVRYNAYCVIMHIKGKPKTMQRNPRYKDLMAEIYSYLEEGIRQAKEKGIAEERIIIDPGIGFGKKYLDNYEILRRLRELTGLGRPILVGPSRKSFIGLTLNLPPEERLEGTIAASVIARLNGANILRVHDVKSIKRAMMIVDATNG